MSRRILVAGSLNMDLVVEVPRHPRPGETVLGGDVRSFPGGKGANQAVAAARAGGEVAMLGLVGSDGYGDALRGSLLGAGVDVRRLGRAPGPSGMAFITVAADGENAGENMIVVSPGANLRFGPEHVGAEPLSASGMLVMQLEIPLGTVETLAEAAWRARVPVLLNPAPAQGLPDALLAKLRYLVLNESEAAMLSAREVTDAQSALRAADALRERGVPYVVVTLGAQGAVWAGPDGRGHQSAFEVEVVDTTAAGDAFCGALAVALTENAALEAAVRFAGAAGALATTRPGAQPSLPTREAIEALLSEGRA